MPNRRLTPEELEKARSLLDDVRRRLDDLSCGDKELLFAYRRKITKELIYDERSGPMERRKLKRLKFKQQSGLCPICQKTLPDKYTVLDRFNAVDGYTEENTRLIHSECDTEIQKSRGYT